MEFDRRAAGNGAIRGATSRANVFLERLAAGELTLMMAVRGARTADVVRVARATGHHAVMIDLEHSTMSVDTAAQLCAAAAEVGLTPLVRVPEGEYGAIGRLLDGGAHGVAFPRVETVAEAARLSRACRFPPRGQRSAIATVPQLGMRPTPAEHLQGVLDDLTVVQVLLETPAGIAEADAIAALEGVDMLVIGANDLTAELGVPGDYRDPRFREAVATVGDACRRHGKLLQLGGVSDLELLATLLPLGVCPLQLTGTDTDLLFAAARGRVENLTSWYTANREVLP